MKMYEYLKKYCLNYLVGLSLLDILLMRNEYA